MIRFSGVSKNFDDKLVLQDLALEIPDGGTTVVLGYSGTGKSVALKLIIGLLEPDSGSVEVDGRIIHDLDRDEMMELRGQMAMVFQFSALFDSMTIGENIRLGLARMNLDDAEMDRRIAESLGLVELEDSRERYPAELSGGMRKRAAIARAIALRPRYILYDEPTTGLDPVTSAVIDQLMLRTQKELGLTGVMVTHDLRSAFTVGTRLALLYEGSIRQVGSVEEMRSSTDPVVRQFLEGRPAPATSKEAAMPSHKA